MKAFQVWQHVITAIKEVERREPVYGERMHRCAVASPLIA